MKNVLCFGDSNTYGYDPETKLRYEFGERWTGILSRSLLPFGVHVDEEGLCGRTTDFDDLHRPGRKGSDVLPILLESHTPGYVIIMLGTNDCKSCYKNSPDDIAAGVEKLVRQVREYNGNVKILIVSPIHLAEGVGEKGYDEAFDENSVRVSRGLKEAYFSVAKRTGCDFLAASEFASPSVADREHLDRVGHRQLASAIFGKIREAV